MKKHIAVILSVLALLISLTSFGLVYLLDIKTNTDINEAKLEFYNEEIDSKKDFLEFLEAQDKINNRIFCSTGIKEACEKQQ